jgi:hypothetical protein
VVPQRNYSDSPSFFEPKTSAVDDDDKIDEPFEMDVNMLHVEV